MASNVKIKRKKNKDLPLILIGAGALLVVGVLIWQAVSFSSSKIPAQPADVARVSLAEAKAALDAGTAVFLDVRSAGAFADSHVAGAINIPEAELPDRLGELDKQDWIITYCT